MSPAQDKSPHPSGGRKAKRAYAAQPYLGPRDAGFYGFLWASGVLAIGGGTEPGTLGLGAAVWAAWLVLGWAASRWLRGQEDFDSGLTDAVASPSAGWMLGWMLPALGALLGMALTAGRCWWEPLAFAGLAGMAAAAPLAFLERSFRLGSGWALVAVLGGLGHPDPTLAVLPLAAGLGLWCLVVASAQAKAFRHFPGGPVPEAGHLAADLALPALVLALAAGASWLWTPGLKPRPVQILPPIQLDLWEPGEERWRPPTQLFGRPRLGAGGGMASAPSASSEILQKALGGLLGRLPQVAAAAALLALGIGIWFWRRRKQAAEAALTAEERKRLILRGAGVQARKASPLLMPADPRQAVVYVYNRLRADLAFLGVPRQEAATPLEYAQGVLKLPQAGDLPMDPLTELFQRAEYSAHPMGPEDASSASEAYRSILKRLTEARK